MRFSYSILSVSKKHCQINYNEGKFAIRDLGSRNGTHLNGKPVAEAIIQAGDRIKVGPLSFVLEIDGASEDAGKQKLNASSTSQQDNFTEQFIASDDITNNLTTNAKESEDLDSLMDGFFSDEANS